MNIILAIIFSLAVLFTYSTFTGLISKIVAHIENKESKESAYQFYLHAAWILWSIFYYLNL